MKPVPIGTIGRCERVATEDQLASKIDPSLAAVLSTPAMIAMMELAAMDAMRQFLEPCEGSVGMAIEVQHTAATPPGHLVRAEAEVTKCEGRRLEFNVRAFDEREQIGAGTHRRAVLDSAKFNERIKVKMKN